MRALIAAVLLTGCSEPYTDLNGKTCSSHRSRRVTTDENCRRECFMAAVAAEVPWQAEDRCVFAICPLVRVCP